MSWNKSFVVFDKIALKLFQTELLILYVKGI